MICGGAGGGSGSPRGDGGGGVVAVVMVIVFVIVMPVAVMVARVMVVIVMMPSGFTLRLTPYLTAVSPSHLARFQDEPQHGEKGENTRGKHHLAPGLLACRGPRINY